MPTREEMAELLRCVEYKEVVMTKVLAFHEIELLPGVSAQEFETFFATEIGSSPIYPGWWAQLLKGDRGERAEKYLVIFEIESREARARYFPTAGEQSEEAKQFRRQNPEIEAVFEKWRTLTTPLGEVYTDYIVVAG
jgi:hypothetical protein